MTIAATAIVLGSLIFVHELGHFVAAKAVGVEVQRFSLGFGPKLVGFTRGETEYVVSAVPLGGYVRMAGMDASRSTCQRARRTPRSSAFRLLTMDFCT